MTFQSLAMTTVFVVRKDGQRLLDDTDELLTELARSYVPTATTGSTPAPQPPTSACHATASTSTCTSFPTPAGEAASCSRAPSWISGWREASVPERECDPEHDHDEAQLWETKPLSGWPDEFEADDEEWRMGNRSA